MGDAVDFTRRGFFGMAMGGAVGAVLPRGAFGAGGGVGACPLKLGLASYTTRKFDLDKTVEWTKRLGLPYLCLKSFHLPLEASAEETARSAAKVREAGLDLYAGGVITMKKPEEVDQAFAYAKAAGLRLIVGAPTPEMLGKVEEAVKAHGIRVAIHNHGPEDKQFPTPQSAYEKIKGMDRRLGLCMDIGHTVRAGEDPAKTAEACADRLFDVHIKDVTAAAKEGKTLEMGRGIIDIPALFRALLKMKFDGVCSFEYEKDEMDPWPGLSESVGYARGVLAALKC
ncbi:MAG TPA: sugar phosphate isomerase/epimerase family protein [Verrucomicrobiae bacterium]|nr:sugar phosphate isomerase/epimerase family protein [Verrucomicrobiae bacterium]